MNGNRSKKKERLDGDLLVPDAYVGYDDLKRRIRKLKKLEIKIRFGAHTWASASSHGQAHLVWEDFFDLRETLHTPASKPAIKSGGHPAEKPARYTLKQLAAMSKDAYKEVVGEFFWNVYYRYYRENGIMDRHAYDPDILSQLGLPFDADSQTVKKRFRDLAKRYHPDAGGEAAQFIEFMEQFRKLDTF